jgi:hypothetical protein
VTNPPLPQQTSSSLPALNCFAVGIPVAVGSYLISGYAWISSVAWMRVAAELICALGLLVSHVFSVTGLYWLIHHASPEATQSFLWVILGCWAAAQPHPRPDPPRGDARGPRSNHHPDPNGQGGIERAEKEEPEKGPRTA